MINRFRTLIGIVALLPDGEAVAYIPGWDVDTEFTIPRYKLTDQIISATEEHFKAQQYSVTKQPFRCYVTVDLSSDTVEELVESMNNWELN